MAEGCRGAD
ncbi:hypothetical protein D047_2858A, partial [Vibrio parahaemolyticus VPTS-2010_2]